MLTYFFKLAIRNFSRFRVQSLISVAGLAIALASCSIIFIFVSYHFSFDKHFENTDEKYRLVTQLNNGPYWANTFPGYSDALVNEPEIEQLTFFVSPSNDVINAGDNMFQVEEFVIADSNFIDFFSVNLLQGNKLDLKKPNAVFISSMVAKKYFNNQEVMGKELLLRKFENHTGDSLGFFTVQGIYSSIPSNSHLGFDMIFSQPGNFDDFIGHIKSRKIYGGNVYVQLHSQNQAAALQAKLPETIVPILGGKHGPGLDAYHTELQPLKNIHFTDDMNWQLRPGIKRSSLFILLSVGIVILLLSVINYTNMLTVRMKSQSKDSGIFKIFGGRNKTLLYHLFTESSTTLLLSMAIAFLILMLFFIYSMFSLPWKTMIIGKNALLITILIILPFIAITTLISFLFMHRIKIIDLLRGENKNHKGVMGTGLLLTFQFSIAVFLIAFTLLTDRQMDYIKDKDLGYDPENVLIFNLPSRTPDATLLKQEIKRIPGVVNSSAVLHHPAYRLQNTSYFTREKDFPFTFGIVDSSGIPTLDIQFVETFKSLDQHERGWIINESFYQALRELYTREEIISGSISAETDNPEENRVAMNIIGIINDFHYSSLHSPIGHFAFALRNPRNQYCRFLMVRYNGMTTNVQRKIIEKMESFYHGIPLKYSYLDEELNQKYEADQRLSSFIKFMSFVAVFIACLGLFGFSLHVIQNRIKEIGIRKVNGAKAVEILAMLNTRFLIWVTIAIVLAVPIAWIILNRWLQSFAYKTPVHWWIFIIAGVIAVFIALITVTWQSWRAASHNPVEALRYE